MILFSNSANQLCVVFFLAHQNRVQITSIFGFCFQVLKAIRANPEVQAKMDWKGTLEKRVRFKVYICLYWTIVNSPLTQASAVSLSGDQGEPGAQGSVNLCDVHLKDNNGCLVIVVKFREITIELGDLFNIP